VVLEGEPDPCIHGVSIRLSGGRKVFIAAFYSAGVTAAERTHEVEQAVHFWQKCRSQGAVMLVGDFNGHSAVGTSAILELQERTGMVCLNASVSTADSQCPAWLPDTAMQPTASTGNVLDLFFGSPSLKRSVSDFEVLPPLVSGTPHFPVKAVFHLTPVRVDDKAEVVERLVTKWKSAYGASKEKKSLYVRCLQDKLEPWLAQWSGSLDCRDNIEAAVSGLRRILQSAGATAFGTKTFKCREGARVWIDRELQLLIRRRNGVARKMQRLQKSGDMQAVAFYKSLFDDLRTAVKLESRRARKRRQHAETDRAQLSSPVFWKWIRRVRNGESAGMPARLRDRLGNVGVTPEEILSTMAAFWAEVVDVEKHSSQRFNTGSWEEAKLRVATMSAPDDEALSEAVNSKAVKSAIGKVERNKAPGVDGVLDWMVVLGKGSSALIDSLTVLFKAMWDTSIIPREWKCGVIVPIHKRDDPADPSNYRPIALCCCVAKLFSRVVADILYDRLEEEMKLPDEQGGFRRGRGAPEMVLALHSLMETRRRHNKRTFLAFVDVKKAYDTVNRDLLSLVLFELDTPGQIWRLVREWYLGDLSCVMMGGKKSDEFPTTLGVKQGDVISPLLFSCYIDGVVDRFDSSRHGVDLRDGQRRLCILLYADDMVLMAESSEMLQEMLDVLSEFMDERRLRVSTGPDQLKSAIMITRVKGDDSPVVQQGFSDLQFLLAGEPIPLVRHYRYLGVMLQDNGRWDRQYSQLRSSLGMRIADMVRAGMHPDGFDPQHGRMLIKAEIIPVVEYACGVWLLSAGQSKKLQSLWNACVRAAFGVPAHTSMPSLLGDLQLIECELQSRWDRCIIADLRHV
jgi:hypothetical protein